MSFAGLEQLEALERRLTGLEERVATRAAPELLSVASVQWAAGQSPIGEAWPLTKDGEVALVALTSQATAHADGATIVLELPDELAYHQHPAQPGHPRRQTLPDDGDDPPPAWVAPIEAAVAAELQE